MRSGAVNIYLCIRTLRGTVPQNGDIMYEILSIYEEIFGLETKPIKQSVKKGAPHHVHGLQPNGFPDTTSLGLPVRTADPLGWLTGDLSRAAVRTGSPGQVVSGMIIHCYWQWNGMYPPFNL